MAYAAKLSNSPHHVFVVMGDGEIDEGSVWEAVMFAAHHRLSNLVAVIDYNKIQSLDLVANTLALEPFEDKWRAFGWAVERLDGHDHQAMARAFAGIPRSADQPSCFILDTIKGKGVSFMEGQVLWHYRSPQGAEFANAMSELGVEA